MTTTPAAPYKGLRYYRSEDAEIFAARERDAERCATLLTGNASVLMLHGRTGCGKSSFLRAALKPFLDTHLAGLRFLENQQGFAVVRSGVTPLREIAIAVYELTEDEQKREPDPVARQHFETVRQGLTKEEFVTRFGSSPDRMADRVRALGKAAKRTPIIVVDQAEEIFTLTDRRGASIGTDNAEPELSLFELEDARADYMSFLRAVAGQSLGVKFLVSLRTEYKGMFEDELRRDMSVEAGPRLAGFHLDDLDEHGLIEAIVSPTKLLDNNNNPVFGFDYDDAVPLAIAQRLLHRDAVPMGGVLPTMQVVCLRLYNETKRARSVNRDSDRWKIRLTDLNRLGDLYYQVEIHLRERLEEMFRSVHPQDAATRSLQHQEDDVEDEDRTTQLDRWYQLLEKLVRQQGDGRAVTRRLTDETLKDHARRFRCSTLIEAGALQSLIEHGILNSERRGETTYWTVGHDSLGLAIQRWGVTYKESIDPTMRIDVNSPRLAAKLKARHLFTEEEAPPPFVVTVPRDLLFDHQLPFFAAARRLSERIGIRFDTPGQLDVQSNTGVEAAEGFRQRIMNYAAQKEAKGRVLVPAERAAFPLPEKNQGWTDLAVSDLFVGNGLVGPVIEGLQSVRMPGAADDPATLDEMRKRLKAVIEYVSTEDTTILSYDGSAKSMMRVAALLAESATQPGASQFDMTHDERYQGDDELFERLLGFSGEQQRNERVFMVGTAYGRALAIHRGYVCYFDCQDLMKIMDLQMKLDPEVGRSESARGTRQDLFREYRSSLFHTVWQINIPSWEWRSIEHYPLMMRIAGLCYFAAEYIRSFPDDFVRYLYDWHADRYNGHARISRETIREMVRDCFTFLSFDENPRWLFDPDSRSEFRPSDGHNKPVPSTVRDLHVELTELRKLTIDRFGELSSKLEQLERYPGERDQARDNALARAEALRGCAWQNFRIYNYYDALRLMTRALEIVQSVVDVTMREVWHKSAVQQSEPSHITTSVSIVS